MIFAIVFGILAVGTIIAFIGIRIMFNNANTFELVQGKLENSDSAIADAMSYLKITNEWSK